MKRRPISDTSVEVSELGFGCSRLGSITRGGSRADSVRLVREALEFGINFFDTSSTYAQGESERALREALEGRRDQTAVLTKLGYVPRSDNRLLYLAGAAGAKLRSKLTGASAQAQCFDLEFLKAGLEASLKRLHSDYVDILLLHSPPTSVLRSGEALEVLAEMKQSGSVRAFGFSKLDLSQDDLAASVTPDVIGTAISTVSESVLESARERGISILGYQPFGGGAALAQSSAESLLAGGLSRSGVASVVAGMSNLSHLEENVVAIKG